MAVLKISVVACTEPTTVADSSVLKVAKVCPTFKISPGLTHNCSTVPFNGEGISITALAVSTDTSN